MAQFEFIRWLAEWLLSQDAFEFDWDDGNSTKSWIKHKVTTDDAEGIFANRDCLVPLGVQLSPKADEPRFGVLGMTLTGRLLSVSFTVRGGKIRIISVRPMSAKERKNYAEVRKE